MKNGSLYKVFAGCFYMLDAKGQKVNCYKDYSMFKNTFGLAFFINSSSTGRCYVIYFAQDNNIKSRNEFNVSAFYSLTITVKVYHRFIMSNNNHTYSEDIVHPSHMTITNKQMFSLALI